MRRLAGGAGLLAAVAFLAAGGFGAAGCAMVGIRSDELPEQPIAFVYYDAETARRRSEELAAHLEQSRGSGQTAGKSSSGDAIAEVSAISSYIRKTFGVAERRDARELAGRLALLDARSGEVTVIEGARKGATPQDWSPDHRRLLFSQVVHGEIPHLFEYDVTTGDVRRRTRGRRAHPEGCYGPDDRIVFTSVDSRSADGNARIMITDATGEGAQRLSLEDYAFYPSCAPDGSGVAYTVVERRRRSTRIMVRSPVLDGQPRLLSAGKEPSFSADSEWIVFSARVKKNWSIWRIRPDGTGRATLGSSGLDEQRPSLSPDNRLVVYVADTKFNQRLYVRRSDGTGNRILLTKGDGDRPLW